MRELSAGEFAAIESNLDRTLASFVYRENEFGRMEAAIELRNGLAPMSAKLKSLQGTLASALAKIDAAAAASQNKIANAADRAAGAIAKVDSLGDEVNQVAAEIEAAVGTESNGGPAG